MVVSVSSVLSGFHHSGVEVSSGSSLRDGRRPPRKSLRAKIVDGVKSAAVALKYLPEAKKGSDNGWQSKCEDVKSRIATLLNCYTMSDVIFQVDNHTIPAHKFILASASPVWFQQLYGEEGGERFTLNMPSPMVSDSAGGESWYNGGAGGLGNRHTVLEIKDVPHLAFFEFLQFIYTDNVNITLENVLPLMLLADTYKVSGLSDRCLSFIQQEVSPATAFKVIHIVRALLSKACLSLWKGIVANNKAIRKFRELTLAERRAKMEELDGGSSVGSRFSSRRGSATLRSPRAGGTLRSSIRSSRGSIRSSGRGFYRMDSDVESLMGEGEFGDTASVLDVAQGWAKKAFRSIQNNSLEARLIGFFEEVNRKCWKTIQEETSAVLQCQDMWEQDVRMLREILSLDTLSVPEIALFRAVADWAQRKCAKNGLKPTAENLREFLGMDTILNLRFPTMTPEQFQWEVVPTGLLEYQDVEQLLYTISKKSAILGRFNGMPRSNINFQKESSREIKGTVSELGSAAAQNVAYGEHMKTLYNPAPDDPVDSILASKLLRGYLKSKVLCDHGDTKATVSEAELAQQATGARLPPISSLVFSPPAPPRPWPWTSRSPAASDQGGRTSRSSSVTTESGLSAASTPRHGMQVPTANPIFERRAEEGTKGGGAAAAPEDFVRICAGLYVLRGTNLLELWVEDGEVMCRDHGPNERLEDPDLEDAEPEDARRILGLPDCPPLGNGTPLDSYLSQQ